MRAGLRLSIAIAAVGLALPGARLSAQTAPPEATTNTPASDSIGPRELQNFNLQGTVTRPTAQQPPPPITAPQTPSRSRTSSTAPRTNELRSGVVPSARQASPEPVVASRGIASADSARSAPLRSQPARPSSGAVALPPVDGRLAGADRVDPPPASRPDLNADTAGSLASRRGFPLLPWLLAALALGAGGVFLFWRSRSREAVASGPQVDAFVTPRPEPVPQPPAPTAKAPAKPAGIVSTRLRPWLELNFDPIRCVVDEEKVTFEFELGLLNSGSAIARDVLIEATLFNAGPKQDREIEAFFASPVGHGQRIAAISPLQRINLRTEVSADRTGLQLYEIAGRHVIVPLIGFNALYRWGVSDGQTSQSFLLGRDTKSEKLAPFRMDLGPRIFRGLAARPLPQFVRS